MKWDKNVRSESESELESALLPSCGKKKIVLLKKQQGTGKTKEKMNSILDKEYIKTDDDVHHEYQKLQS